jgi:hypothetical protein
MRKLQRSSRVAPENMELKMSMEINGNNWNFNCGNEKHLASPKRRRKRKKSSLDSSSENVIENEC